MSSKSLWPYISPKHVNEDKIIFDNRQEGEIKHKTASVLHKVNVDLLYSPFEAQILVAFLLFININGYKKKTMDGPLQSGYRTEAVGLMHVYIYIHILQRSMIPVLFTQWNIQANH